MTSHTIAVAFYVGTRGYSHALNHKNRFQVLVPKKRVFVLRGLTGTILVLTCVLKGTGHGPIRPLTPPHLNSPGAFSDTCVWRQGAYKQQKLLYRILVSVSVSSMWALNFWQRKPPQNRCSLFCNKR